MFFRHVPSYRLPYSLRAVTYHAPWSGNRYIYSSSKTLRNFSSNRQEGQEGDANSSTTAVSFFRFVPIADPDSVALNVREALKHWPGGCLGTVYVSKEGLNAALCIPTRTIDTLRATILSTISEIDDLHINVGRRISQQDARPFKKLLIKSRKSIITDGLPYALDWTDSGREVSASTWHEELSRVDDGDGMPPLVIDCRNSYESNLGQFENAIALNTSAFSESWGVLDHLLESVPKERKILTYCTGGIRCVKVNAYIKQKLGHQNLYRLSDGIISYENWVEQKENKGKILSKFCGENYLFDNRREKSDGTFF